MQRNSNKDNREGEPVYIPAFGCQMNDADSEVIGRLLEREGYRKIDSPEETDVIILKKNN